jgi:PAS domain S-box-containing protein
MHDSREVELHRYLSCQRELAERLINGDSLEEVAPAFLSEIADLLRWEAGAMWEVRDDEPALRFVCGWSVSELEAEPLWELSRSIDFVRGHGLIGRAWDEGQITWASRVGDDPGYPRRKLAAGLELVTGLAIPISLQPGGDVLAVAEFHTKSGETHPEQVFDLLRGFGEQLAAFITRRREEAQVRYDRADGERARQHLAEVVRGTQDAVLSKDLDGIVTSWNPAAERLYGYSEEEAVGRHISFLIPSDHANEENEILRRVKAGERLETYETERMRADGARIAVSLTISPIQIQSGLIGASVIARDITSERRQRKGQEFLLAATRLLDSSLDPERTARTIVKTAVPELAEICVLDFLRDDGWFGDSIVAGVDSEAAARLERIRRESPLDPAGPHPVAQVFRARHPMVWRDLKAPNVIADVAQSDSHRQLMDDAGYNSAAVVELRARGRTVGVLSFLHASKDLRYDPADLDFLTELADRAALVLDNARLYRERDLIARNLQLGLRPPQPAEVPGLGISVVFEAAGRGIEVGGDFYDVLPTEDGCWLLIGDVAGKGSAAAGVSVAVRHSVRGLTREIDEPDEVLRRVNELLLTGDTLNDFATGVLVRLRRRSSEWHLALASAGHPPAIIAGPGGSMQLGGGSVLGAWEEAVVQRHEAALGTDDTLVLCTDGWLEAGPVAFHADSEALAALTDSLSALELDELTRQLRNDAVGRGSGELRDDLVVLAVRPTPVAAKTAGGGEKLASA